MKTIAQKMCVPVWPELAWSQSPVGMGEELRSSCWLRGGDPAALGRLRSDPHPLASAGGRGQHSLAVTLRVRKGWATLPPHLQPPAQMSFCGAVPAKPQLSGDRRGDHQASVPAECAPPRPDA